MDIKKFFKVFLAFTLTCSMCTTLTSEVSAEDPSDSTSYAQQVIEEFKNPTTSGQTGSITLTDNVDLSGEVITVDNYIYLNLNGYTITMDGGCFVVENVLEIRDYSDTPGSIISNAKHADYSGLFNVDGGTLTVKNVTINANYSDSNAVVLYSTDDYSRATFSLSSGVISADGYAISTVKTPTADTVISISGGIINGDIYSTGTNNDSNVNDISLYGGTINGDVTFDLDIVSEQSYYSFTSFFSLSASSVYYGEVSIKDVFVNINNTVNVEYNIDDIMLTNGQYDYLFTFEETGTDKYKLVLSDTIVAVDIITNDIVYSYVGSVNGYVSKDVLALASKILFTLEYSNVDNSTISATTTAKIDSLLEEYDYEIIKYINLDATMKLDDTVEEVYELGYHSFEAYVKEGVRDETGTYILVDLSKTNLTYSIGNTKTNSTEAISFICYNTGTFAIVYIDGEIDDYQAPETSDSIATPAISAGTNAAQLNTKLDGKNLDNLFTDEELTQDATVLLSIAVKSLSTLTSDESALIDAVFADEELPEGVIADLCMVLDMSLYKVVGDYTKNLSELSDVVRITIDIPEEYLSTSTFEEFYMFRIHEGELTYLEDLDSDPLTFTFETDRFSTYVLFKLYAESEDDDNDTTVDTDDTTVDTDDSVDTGDTTNLVFLFTMLFMSLMGTALVLKKQN